MRSHARAGGRVRRKQRVVQYTVLGVPSEVDDALRQKAQRENRSLNEVLVEAIRSGAGLGGEARVYTDLDHLIGKWGNDPELDRALEEQRQIDPELWR
jgi:hypothetical protein